MLELELMAGIHTVHCTSCYIYFIYVLHFIKNTQVSPNLSEDLYFSATGFVFFRLLDGKLLLQIASEFSGFFQ